MLRYDAHERTHTIRYVDDPTKEELIRLHERLWVRVLTPAEERAVQVRMRARLRVTLRVTVRLGVKIR